MMTKLSETYNIWTYHCNAIQNNYTSWQRRFLLPLQHLRAVHRQFLVALQGHEHLNQREVRVACFSSLGRIIVTIVIFQLVLFWCRHCAGIAEFFLGSLAGIRNYLCVHFVALTLADGLPISFLELLAWVLWFMFYGAAIVATWAVM